MNANMTITDNAAKRIQQLRQKQGNDKLMLRVTVLGGGCSGFQYELSFDDQVNDGDLTFENAGAVVVTDEISMPYLNEAKIDFIQSMMKSEFKIFNPNAASGCGCGQSFSVRQ